MNLGFVICLAWLGYQLLQTSQWCDHLFSFIYFVLLCCYRSNIAELWDVRIIPVFAFVYGWSSLLTRVLSCCVLFQVASPPSLQAFFSADSRALALTRSPRTLITFGCLWVGRWLCIFGLQDVLTDLLPLHCVVQRRRELWLESWESASMDQGS